MGFEWEVPPEQAFPPLADAAAQQIKVIVYQLMLSYAPRIEAWMKQNAAWMDRTGNARQGLYAEVEAFATQVSLIADHSMDYGFWLETRHAGRYAIIAPAIDHFYPQIVSDLRQILG